VPGQARAIGAGALDADPGQLAELADPGQHRPVSGSGGGEAAGAEHRFARVDHGGDVQILVSVHAGEDGPAGRGGRAALALW
jgi:hypothetical protein